MVIVCVTALKSWSENLVRYFISRLISRVLVVKYTTTPNSFYIDFSRS